jgi:hypothetical protein
MGKRDYLTFGRFNKIGGIAGLAEELLASEE